ncbi:MAG: hypothetical protein KAZ87_10125 [Spirochaetes bacterium]|nr:hypothetical protein [Spirochaetota bacterium]
MTNYIRAFEFMFQVFGMIKKNTILLRPLFLNIGIGAIISILLSVGIYFLSNATLVYVFLFAGLIIFYFNAYFNNGMTACLIYDLVTEGKPDFKKAFSKTSKSFFGIMVFATITAFLEILVFFAEERESFASKVILSIIRSIWTTATYFVMPAMVIEELGFIKAFSSSKQIMKKDPTQAGIGIVAIGIVTWVMDIIFTALAGGAFYLLSGFSVILAGITFFLILNIFWGLSGYIKITYFTCFYVWAKNCANANSSEVSLAPKPLAAVLAD